MFEFITVRELYEMFLSNQMMDLEGYEYVELEGWVRTNRNNGKLGFIALNDGTYFKNLHLKENNHLKLKQLRLKSKVNVMKIFHYKRNVIHSNTCVKYRI